MLVIDLGVKNFGDFELGFIIDHDCWWMRLNMIRGFGLGRQDPPLRHGTLGVCLETVGEL